MHPKVSRYLCPLIVLSGTASFSVARAASLTPSPAGLSVQLDEATGAYSVTAAKPNWTFGGSLDARPTRVVTRQGEDRLGKYQEVSFRWEATGVWDGSIRSYQDRPLLTFAVTSPKGANRPTPDFPSFTSFPRALHYFSYNDTVFSPSVFRLAENSTPWLLFDDAANTAVLSPASDFIVSQMHGNGKDLIASGLTPKLASVPAGFTHTSCLLVESGINRAFRGWGNALTTLSGKPRTADNADALVKYLGYWTDNGAHYYYNYDKTKGYTGTLLAVRDHYKQQNIPIHYMQLDSWWYQKSRQRMSGSIGGPKNADLPIGNWNAYGGTLEYSASPVLFPRDLGAFYKDLGMPFAVHGRWIDPLGPYPEKYKLSGVAPIDPRWWNDRMAYLKANGVITYEQDWLNEIYNHTPEMARDLSIGSAFADGMAQAAQKYGLTLQYCMPTPRFFLQGSRYPNLTTIRPSADRFERNKWNHFLYTSLLADAVNVRPWTDVFKSNETGNLTIATLSSGPVGFGDEIGKESRADIMRAARADGVIIKPDAPLLPLDASILADAKDEKQPLLAATYTENGPRTAYVLAATRTDDSSRVAFKPADLGLSGPVYVYDSAAKTARRLDAAATYSATLDRTGWALYTVAPVGPSGIAFLGDVDKIVGTGRQRVAAVRDEAGQLSVTLTAVPGESSITLGGFAAREPVVTAGGVIAPVNFDAATGRFTVAIAVPADTPVQVRDGDPVRTVTVVLGTR